MRYVLTVLFGLACAAAGFAAKAALENRTIAGFLRDSGPQIALVALAGLVLLGVMLVAGYLYARHRLRRLLRAEGALTEAQIAQGLVDMVTTPEGITNPTPRDRQRAALVNAGVWLMRRQATQFYFNAVVTVMGGLIGTATLFLLYEQNQKIEMQTQRITLQTDASIAQSVLLEGSRRAALSAEMTQLFLDIRTAVDGSKPDCAAVSPRHDCWQVDRAGQRLFRLPEILADRTTAFASRSVRYRLAQVRNIHLDFDTPLREQFDFVYLSPERGQLLEVLVRNRVDTAGLDFSGAQSGRLDARGAALAGIVLNAADLANAQFQGAGLKGAQLQEADLSGANMTGADLSGANLQGANLGTSQLSGAQISDAVFTGAAFRVQPVGPAWAWSDRKPRNWPETFPIVYCDARDRGARPDRRPYDCGNDRRGVPQDQ